MNKNLQPLARNKDLETICQNVNDSYFALSDAMEQLKAYVDGFEMSEDDINAMEERLYEIQKLKHKYGGSIDAILNRRNELEQQAERITHRREYLESMNQKVEQALTEYSRKAAALSAVRKKGSPSLDRQIAKNLKELVLPNAVFVTQISADQPSAKGSDKVEFLISMYRISICLTVMQSTFLRIKKRILIRMTADQIRIRRQNDMHQTGELLFLSRACLEQFHNIIII